MNRLTKRSPGSDSGPFKKNPLGRRSSRQGKITDSRRILGVYPANGHVVLNLFGAHIAIPPHKSVTGSVDGRMALIEQLTMIFSAFIGIWGSGENSLTKRVNILILQVSGC